MCLVFSNLHTYQVKVIGNSGLCCIICVTYFEYLRVDLVMICLLPLLFSSFHLLVNFTARLPIMS